MGSNHSVVNPKTMVFKVTMLRFLLSKEHSFMSGDSQGGAGADMMELWRTRIHDLIVLNMGVRPDGHEINAL